MRHNEIPTKVNAWVDKGIEPLVRALNEFENIVTVDSCEGSSDAPGHVFFITHGDDLDLFNTVTHLSQAIRERSDGYRLQIEWVAGSERPMAALFAPRDQVPELANEIMAAVSGDHKTVSGRDIQRPDEVAPPDRLISFQM